MNKSNTKEKLYLECKSIINDKIKALNYIINSIEEGRNNETKSSAGDKFGTSRSLMQIEIERNIDQLLLAIENTKILSMINLS